MKILALELNGESVARNPSRYGGIGRTLSILRNNLDNFFVAGTSESFSDCGLDDKVTHNILLRKDQVEQIRSGEHLAKSIDNLKDYDIIFHASSSLFLNLDGFKAKQVVWPPGFQDEVHPHHNFLLLHNRAYQHPRVANQPKFFNIVLGIDIPEFQNYQKQDLIFQCSNHYPAINTSAVAEFCKRYGIQFYFAGPIDENYHDLKSRMNNDFVHYLGIIKEEEKIEWLKKAKVVTALYSHPISDPSLSVKQALSYGCAIMTTNAGATKEVIKHDKNGWLVNTEQYFFASWLKRNKISQLDCYNSIRKYSVENMIESFQQAFLEIVDYG